MSQSKHSGPPRQRAVALQYNETDGAPVVIASGMGYLAEKIIETAADSGVPVYEDNSLATILSQLQLGQEIPPALYQAIVEIYVYLLEFDPETGKRKEKNIPPALTNQPNPAQQEES